MLPSAAHEAIRLLSSSEEMRAKVGTNASLRRAITRFNTSHPSLLHSYASVYRTVLRESQLLFVHLSKSGGTVICELSKMNGCLREGASSSSYTTNCFDRKKQDGPWWFPPETILRIEEPGLKRFVRSSMETPLVERSRIRSCTQRRRTPSFPRRPTFSAVEGALPRQSRCAGIIEMLLLRQPIARMESFGRELHGRGLLFLPMLCGKQKCRAVRSCLV